jgi:3-(3-hydroxy-phenyl)propionate hydroxylase
LVVDSQSDDQRFTSDDAHGELTTMQADVAVVGAGPCGITLANLLGTYGVSTIVFDRESEIMPYPRAVAVDDESLRTFQSAGLVDGVLKDVIQNAPIRYYNSRGRRLAHVRPSGQPYGWPRRNLFYQPLMEKALRQGIDRFDHVRLHSGVEITDLRQTTDGVLLRGTSADGDFAARARYVVGADGGRSFVRGAVGIELTGATAPSKWLVVDVEHDTLDAPFSAVYCHPDRPTMTIPLPYGYRRFEFKLLPGEQEDAIVTDDAVNRLLAPFYAELPMPKLMGRRVYWHHSRIASTFQAGRVFLAGDAAHLQPPFFGQGMNSGIRDATNLAWKLAAVAGGNADPRVLDSYDAERRGHAETMVSFATRVGSMYQPRNRVTETIRDAVFRGVQRIPGARDYILQMKYKPAPRYTRGVVARRDDRDTGSPVGRLFPQPAVETPEGVRRKLDDAVGSSFAVLGLGVDPAAHLSAANAAYWTMIGAVLMRVNPSRTGRREPVAAEPPARSVDVYDIDGAFRDMRLDRPQDQVIILRPDRYVAASGRASELDAITEQLRRITGDAAS